MENKKDSMLAVFRYSKENGYKFEADRDAIKEALGLKESDEDAALPMLTAEVTKILAKEAADKDRDPAMVLRDFIFYLTDIYDTSLTMQFSGEISEDTRRDVYRTGNMASDPLFAMIAGPDEQQPQFIVNNNIGGLLDGEDTLDDPVENAILAIRLIMSAIPLLGKQVINSGKKAHSVINFIAEAFADAITEMTPDVSATVHTPEDQAAYEKAASEKKKNRILPS